MILSLDTTSEFGSIALTGPHGTVEEISIHAPEGFGHVLFSHIAGLLSRHRANVHQMECFAAASGPGSFTGVRVGLAAAKGLAEAVGKRVIAVSNLQALAACGSRPLRATVLDARRGQIYGCVFDANLHEVTRPAVIAFPEWLETLPVGDLEIIAFDFTALRDSILPNIPLVTAPRALAAVIGKIAWEQKAAGTASDPAQIDANYVRRSDAELFWKE